MNREEMLYQIYFSYCVELKFSRIMSRIDKSLSFALILLGSSVIGRAGDPFWIGLSVAAISAIKMAFHFEASASQAKKHANAYLKLYNLSENEPSDSSLQNKIVALQEGDSDVWSVLITPAGCATRSALGKPKTTKLNFKEKLFDLLTR